MRYLLVTLLVLGACKDKDGEDSAKGGEKGGSGAKVENTEAREELSAAQIATLLPAKVNDWTACCAGDRQGLTMRYAKDEGKAVHVSISDLVDRPEFHERHRESLQDETLEKDLGPRKVKYEQVDSENVGGSWVWKAKDDRGLVSVRSLLDDRFLVQMNSPDVSLEELHAFWKEHIRPALEGAPVHADAGSGPGPEWMSMGPDGTKLGAAANEGSGPALPDLEEQPKLAELLPCDELLPPAEIERICGVANVKAEPTEFESGGACNRVYRIEGKPDYGMILLVSGFRDFETAKKAFLVSIDVDAEVEIHEDVGAVGASFELLNNEILKFFARNALVEIKVAALATPDSRMGDCLEPDKLQELARGVADRIAKAP